MKRFLLLALMLTAGASPAAASPVDSARLDPAPHAYPGDPADSLYSAGRSALAAGHYRDAAALFERVARDYPSSRYASSALYYQAFALYRDGDLRDARSALTTLAAKFPRAARRGDARSLDLRICGALARQGDRACKGQITEQAMSDEAASNPDASAHTPEHVGSDQVAGCPADDDDNDTRIAALNALMQVDADQALPILRKVLARRDRCSAALRHKALFLVSQKHSPESADILLAAAREDPDADVRQQAVFWLSQVHDARALGMLDSLLLHSKDPDLREKALFAISQHHDAGADQTLRDFATNTSEDQDLRERALFWLGQSGDASNTTWLKSQFFRETNPELKEKILFSVSQRDHAESGPWLLTVAADSTQPEEVRKKAVFWAGQTHVGIDKLAALYDRTSSPEIHEALLFAYSQSHDPAAVDALMHIAKSDHDTERRKKAIFWLGQSHDPRAAQFLAQLIDQ